jgi:E3 ubiquitin-protein ligase BRE1
MVLTLAQDRLAAMKSEMTRLRMKLAAQSGDVEAVQAEATGDVAAQLDALRDQHRIAQNLIVALRDQLKSYSSNSGTAEAQTIMKSETAARQELAEMKETLGKLG